MIFLITASLIWMLSFGLIKRFLEDVNPDVVAFIRMAISMLVFLPFVRRSIKKEKAAGMILLGALQYGLMYAAYIRAYHYLPAHQVALMTAFTPIFVSMIYDAIQRQFHITALIAAIAAVAGSIVILWSHVTGATLRGIMLIQGANLCFALGQVSYKCIAEPAPVQKNNISNLITTNAPNFFYMYLGATLLTGIFAAFSASPQSFSFTKPQIAVLLYLGILPSGIAFFLWNTGATRVNAAVLAVFNNLKIPLAVIAALIITGEQPDLVRLISGSIILLAALAFAARPAPVARRQGL